MQLTVLAISLIVMAFIAAQFITAVRSAPGTVATGAERLRSRLIIGLAIVGLVVSAVSLARWPHAVAAKGVAAVVNVSGGQWYWEIDTAQVPLGLVVFNAQTADVTHGFGITDADGTILVQTQVIPGYVNRTQYTFEQPGTYRLVCLEYCGVAHHDMINEFEVAAR